MTPFSSIAAIALVVRAVPSPDTRLWGNMELVSYWLRKSLWDCSDGTIFLFLQKGSTKRQGVNLIVHVIGEVHYDCVKLSGALMNSPSMQCSVHLSGLGHLNVPGRLEYSEIINRPGVAGAVL